MNLDIVNPLASVIVFQYNPETVTRRLSASGDEGGGAQSEQLRLKGPAAETMTMEIELDATDLLEVADPIAVGLGIAPALASLELMLSPKTAEVVVKAALAAAGLIEVVPPAAPLTLLGLGPGPRAARASHRAGDHRGGLRQPAQPDPSQGRGRPSGCSPTTISDW